MNLPKAAPTDLERGTSMMKITEIAAYCKCEWRGQVGDCKFDDHDLLCPECGQPVETATGEQIDNRQYTDEETRGFHAKRKNGLECEDCGEEMCDARLPLPKGAWEGLVARIYCPNCGRAGLRPRF